jgi:hypothetical protein
MFASPTKRRKTSPTASVAVDASNTPSNPSTPKRASFQSPTKASLARSHPNLLPQSAGRSQVQTRGQGLRQELLNRRTSQSVPKPSTAEPQTLKFQNEPAGDKPADSTTAGTGSFSGVIRNLFAAEPSRLPASSQTPLRARQPPIRLVKGQNRNNDLQISKQAQIKHPRGRPGLNNDDEPELPPTPVQLGLSTQPNRPRGLASSSPGRSSGSSRQRTRLNESRHTSSPTKLRVQTQTVADSPTFVPPQAPAIALAGEEAPEEAPESDAEAPVDEEEEPSVPEAVLQKCSLRDSLSAQLAHLQSDIASLENALADSDEATPTSVDVDQSLLTLLTSTNPSCAEPAPKNNVRAYSPTFPNPTALGSKPVPYLTLFAPGNLQLHSTTSTTVIDGKAHQIHVLELLAPELWPAHIFGATIKVTVDVEEKQVRAVEVVKLRLGMGHQALREWIGKRLDVGDGLHRYDVGGLVWGMGRWWEECVARARGWRKLEERFHNKSSKKQKYSHENAELLVQEEIKALLPHLTRTSMEFELGTAKRVTRSNKGVADQEQISTKVMLLWDLLLDWTGEVDETVGVAVAGMGSQGEQGVKDVFGKIFKRDGVFQAMEAVSGVLAKEDG